MMLSEQFDPRHNSLNALRLIFALSVIVSHASPLGGYGTGWEPGGETLGFWAVAGFFAISGFLITRSRYSPTSNTKTFAWHRALRIYPGLWVCLLLTAAVFAPLAWVAERGPLEPMSLLAYVAENITGWIRADTIPGTLIGVAQPEAWGGPLWTLFYEVLCYAALAVFAAVGFLRRRVWLMPVTLVVGSLVAVARHEAIAANQHNALVLGLFFVAGATLYPYVERVPTGPVMTLAALTALLLVGRAGRPKELAALPVAYLCLWAGTRLPLHRVGARRDLSYGVYIYGWSVAQLLAVYGLADDGLLAYTALTVAGTLPLAWLSWTLVEEPALRLKRRPDRRGAAAPAGIAPP